MTNKSQVKTAARIARHKRIRARIKGTEQKLRLAVYRSNNALYAQFINDDAGKTLLAADTRTFKGTSTKERALEMAKDLAAKAKKAGIEAVVFDRGGFKYQGTIAAFADAMREAGLKF